jgi:lipid-A-disaccharide synthase
MKNILIIAGEASGDTLGAGLVREFQKLKPEYKFFGFGGDKMKKLGVDIVYHINQLAIIGFWEVVKNIRFILRVRRDILNEVEKLKPSMAILIDYPGFNLRLARQLKNRGVKVLYYISPQIWAWGGKRIRQIKQNVDHMTVIFEFERELYEKAEVPVTWVGHPLLEEIDIKTSYEDFLGNCGFNHDEVVLGLFPGSREQEVKRILPEMLMAMKIITVAYPKVRAVIGKAPAIDFDFYQEIMDTAEWHVPLYAQSNYDIMKHAKANIVCSGTATLECGMIGTPLIVVYKTSPITYMIARRLIKLPNIGMVNLVAGKEVVPELIQKDCNGQKIAEYMLKYLNNTEYYESTKSALADIKSKLGEMGASKKAAETAIELLQ